MGYENCGKHPNSLKQLRPLTDSDKARELQAKGAEVRRANKAAREAMKLSMAEWKKIKEEVLPESMSALDILKIAMMKAVSNEDMDEVTRLAAIIAEYENPKLQRVDQTSLELSNTDLTDEELEAKIKELQKSGNSD